MAATPTPTVAQAARTVAEHWSMLRSWGDGLPLQWGAYGDKLAETNAALDALVAAVARDTPEPEDDLLVAARLVVEAQALLRSWGDGVTFLPVAYGDLLARVAAASAALAAAVARRDDEGRGA